MAATQPVAATQPGALRVPFKKCIVPATSVLVPVVYQDKNYRCKKTNNGKTSDGKTSNEKSDYTEFLRHDLDVSRLTKVERHLWLAGMRKAARPLHRQVMMDRNVVVTEQADLHLTWRGSRIYIKPLPGYLLNVDFWKENIEGDSDLFKNAKGFLLSYVWLVFNESDFQMAMDNSNHPRLLPEGITYQEWSDFIADFMEGDDFEDMEQINPRYRFGELRLNRLNSIYRIKFGTKHFIRGYFYGYHEYGTFLEHNFAWIVTFFAYVAIVLTAMQVGLATKQLMGNDSFHEASYGFTVFSITSPLVAVGVIGLILLVTAADNVMKAYNHERNNIRKPEKLEYLFPPGVEPSAEPLWIDSQDPSNFLSEAQVLEWSKSFSMGLGNTGIHQDEAVMIFTPNHIFVPVAYLGIVGGGYRFSAGNPAFTLRELVHQIEDVQPSVVLVHPDFVPLVVEAVAKIGLSSSKIFQFSDVECTPVLEIPDWRVLLHSECGVNEYAWPSFTPEESLTKVATINYSSGTTGHPKGVMISHANIIANAAQNIFNLTHNRQVPLPDDRWLGYLPLYHAYGQLYLIIISLKRRIPVYVMKEFVFEEFLYAIQTYRITTLQLVPPILVMMSKHPNTSKYDLSSLTLALCAAAPLSKELQNHCSKRFGFNIIQGYGMTETTCGGMGMLAIDVDDTGSIGKLLPNTECKLMDDYGQEVSYGQPGELYLRGPQIALGYWRNEAATNETIDTEGWLRTGDIAVCNAKENFWIIDRKKELIKVNGFQVAPAELEAVLLENEHVADAGVVGIKFGEEELPRAYVAIQEASKGKVSPQDIEHWIKSRVAKYKYLVGGVVFIQQVPKLASGKIQRRVLREWAKKDGELMQRRIQSRL
ncbi:hypothetical protein V502_09073 [Pseudogymnoascus sp. VKM F-4520 (FW-2644)]|nr:hypothetical protein V502_09073 [Pseudogymnoascus sp. VKM F-4520 (FW-2644)]